MENIRHTQVQPTRTGGIRLVCDKCPEIIKKWSGEALPPLFEIVRTAMRHDCPAEKEATQDEVQANT